ncbi:hypothetical protein [Parendozoicomonas sp. Alg238-R29]|uniref:hypothetical protein n=1 Tax=Parendozoicomonas sp. Alg238-R29 TaxID=2993446 RepID=UPI00248DA8C9|nr:hypothetical protein [Parendozoicomonas sp. Alg238-R29]
MNAAPLVFMPQLGLTVTTLVVSLSVLQHLLRHIDVKSCYSRTAKDLDLITAKAYRVRNHLTNYMYYLNTSSEAKRELRALQKKLTALKTQDISDHPHYLSTKQGWEKEARKQKETLTQQIQDLKSQLAALKEKQDASVQTDERTMAQAEVQTDSDGYEKQLSEVQAENLALMEKLKKLEQLTEKLNPPKKREGQQVQPSRIPVLQKAVRMSKKHSPSSAN